MLQENVMPASSVAQLSVMPRMVLRSALGSFAFAETVDSYKSMISNTMSRHGEEPYQMPWAQDATVPTRPLPS